MSPLNQKLKQININEANVSEKFLDSVHIMMEWNHEFDLPLS